MDLKELQTKLDLIEKNMELLHATIEATDITFLIQMSNGFKKEILTELEIIKCMTN